jgi:hypothetical protein
LKTDIREATPNAAAQWHGGAAFGLHCVTENVADFFFHAVAVTTRLPLESSLYARFEISDDQLCHGIYCL